MTKFSLRYVLLWMSLCLASVAEAAPVTHQQALRKAAAFLEVRGRSVLEPVPYRQAAPAMDSASQPFYVFSVQNGGFVVVSGEDATVPVLGYAERGSFDEDNLPEGLGWLLQTYAEQISWLRASGATSAAESVESMADVEGYGKPQHMTPVRRNIEPLMSTLWNQGDPYNLLCPRYFNQDGSEGDRCATGCVATAVAQVMAFYRHPQATTRTIPGYVARFSTDQGEKTVQLRNIPAGSVIDWDNMLDVYQGGESEAQKQAVAQLMYWVGLGSKMSYGPSSATGFSDAVNGLVRYFGYDDGTHIESRGSYTIQGWSDFLYDELANGHPLAFAGTNSGGAHAFVVDGYDVEGLFHLNWGWGGMDNGYFRIDVLDPDDSSGIGASPAPGGYNMGQEAIVLRLPDDETATPAAPKLTVNDWEIRNGNTFFANYINWSGVAADWNAGIARVADDGSLLLVGSYNTVQLAQNYYIGFEFPVRGLAEGSYRLVPVSKRTADTDWQTDVNAEIRFVRADVDAEGNVSLSIHPVVDIEVTEVAFPGNHKKGDTQLVTAAFSNHGEEYFGEVHLFASRNGQMGEQLCRTAVSMQAGGETVAAFHFTPQQTGSWTVWLAADDRGQQVLAQASVEITNEGVARNDNLRCMSLSVSNRSNGTIYGNCMQGTVSVRNQGEETYDGQLRLWLFKNGFDGYYYGVTSVFVPANVEPGVTAHLPFFFDNLELNAEYAMSIIYEQGGDITNGGLRQLGRTQKGIVCWLSDNTLSGLASTSIVNVPAKALAVDMRTVANAVVTVRANDNPNTLYLLSEEAAVPGGLETANVVRGSRADAIALSEGWPFFSPVAFTAGEVNYQCTPPKKRWQTLALPFTAEALPGGIRLLQFAAVDDDGQPVFTDAGSLERNIPYLLWTENDASVSFTAHEVRFSATQGASMAVGTESVRFCGTTTGGEWENIWVLNDEGDAFVLAVDAAQVPPFGAYFSGEGLSSVIQLPAGGDNAVPSVTVQKDSPAVFYNLQGQRVERPQKGVYITNHKKIILW